MARRDVSPTATAAGWISAGVDRRGMTAPSSDVVLGDLVAHTRAGEVVVLDFSGADQGRALSTAITRSCWASVIVGNSGIAKLV